MVNSYANLVNNLYIYNQIKLNAMSEIGYTPKNLLFDQEGRDKLFAGIKKISAAVKSTMGPSGQTVLIESNRHLNGMTVTKDGVTVAKSIDLIDPVENLAVRIMKQASEKTATEAGDGTTTAIVLTEAIINAAIDLGLADSPIKTQVLRDIVLETEKIVDSLSSSAKKINNSYPKLQSVAAISSNNDQHLGNIIADVYTKVGEDGIVTIDRSMTEDTHFEFTKGIKVGRGYESPVFINNQSKDECVLEKPYVLVSDAPIENLLNIEGVLAPIIKEQKKLLIIAPVAQNVLHTLAANVAKNNIKLCVIQPPSFGYKQQELMSDIAISLGATYFSEKTGDDLSLISLSDLGQAEKIIVDKDSTVIIREEQQDIDLGVRIEELREAQKNAEKKADKEFIGQRIASLTGGIGVVYVGGRTETERQELHDRVDDAICAVRSALEEGIVTGGGLALYRESEKLSMKEDSTLAQKILSVALEVPSAQIAANAGLYFEVGVELHTGLNVKTNEVEDLMKAGVIDPVKVTKSALKNAVSVACTLLSTNAIVTMARTYEDK